MRLSPSRITNHAREGSCKAAKIESRLMLHQRRPLKSYLLWGTLCLVALAVVIVFAKPLTTRQNKAKPAVDLRVADKDGRMRVDWDPSNPAIQSAQGATLEVEDGKSFNRYPVEANVLRSGGLDY